MKDGTEPEEPRMNTNERDDGNGGGVGEGKAVTA